MHRSYYTNRICTTEALELVFESCRSLQMELKVSMCNLAVPEKRCMRLWMLPDFFRYLTFMGNSWIFFTEFYEQFDLKYPSDNVKEDTSYFPSQIEIFYRAKLGNAQMFSRRFSATRQNWCSFDWWVNVNYSYSLSGFFRGIFPSPQRLID